MTDSLRKRIEDRLLSTAKALDHSEWWCADGWLHELGDLLACWSWGHPGRPRFFPGRFEARPWRCQRCGTWMVTRMGQAGWEWQEIGTPGPLKHNGPTAMEIALSDD